MRKTFLMAAALVTLPLSACSSHDPTPANDTTLPTQVSTRPSPGTSSSSNSSIATSTSASSEASSSVATPTQRVTNTSDAPTQTWATTRRYRPSQTPTSPHATRPTWQSQPSAGATTAITPNPDCYDSSEGYVDQECVRTGGKKYSDWSPGDPGTPTVEQCRFKLPPATSDKCVGMGLSWGRTGG